MLSDWRDYLDLTNYRRVLQVAETPSASDFLQVLKITAAGIGILGTLGYVMYAIVFFLPGGV